MLFSERKEHRLTLVLLLPIRAMPNEQRTPTPVFTYVYAILDRVAGQVTGSLVMFKHPAAAVRFFNDIAQMQGSIISAHPADFELVQLGYLTIEMELVPEYETIMTGLAWQASQSSGETTPPPAQAASVALVRPSSTPSQESR